MIINCILFRYIIYSLWRDNILFLLKIEVENSIISCSINDVFNNLDLDLIIKVACLFYV